MANDGLTVKVEGLQEAMLALNGFSKGVQVVQARKSVDAGGGVLKRGAQSRITEDTGTTKKHLISKAGNNKQRTRAYAVIGLRRGVKVAVHHRNDGTSKAVSTTTRKKDGTLKTTAMKRLGKLTSSGASMSYRVPSRIAHLIEKGTKSHTVSAKNKQVLARAGTVFGRSVRVSAKAKPFLDPTVRSDGPAAVSKSISKLKEGIEQERAKAWARSKKPR